MEFVALISGGKDSMYTIQKGIDEGGKLKGLLYMEATSSTIDSYMYQTVGSELIKAYGICLNVPLFIYKTNCRAVNKNLEYRKTAGDEVEDLFFALKDIKEKIDFNTVSSGAILSTYQKLRVENVCDRLNLTSYAPLWNLNQQVLFDDIRKNIHALIIKTASFEFNREVIGMSLSELNDYYHRRKFTSSFNFCGEGGEFESLVLDMKYFQKRISIDESEIHVHEEDSAKETKVFYMRILKYSLIDKFN